MSSGNDLPRGADRFARQADPRPNTADAAETGDVAPGLFDPASNVRSIHGRSGGSATTEPAASQATATHPATSPSPRTTTSSLLGTGAETSRNLGTTTLDRHDLSRHGPFAPAAPTLPTPPLERLVDGAYRWRTALGLGLAALMTLSVVVAYQLQSDDDLIAAESAGAGAEGRSALAAITDFDDPADAETSSTSVVGDRQVNSAVDDAGDPVADPGESTAGTPTTASPAGPTTTMSASEATASTAPTVTIDPAAEASSTTDPAAPTSTDTSIDGSSSTSSTPDATTSTTVEGATTTESTPSSTSTTDTTAQPPATVRVEAETGTLLGTARARSDHSGFSGSGFVGDIITEGSGVTLTVDAPGGATPFLVRYSAGPDNGPAGPRTLSVLVNGVRVSETRMRLTASWDEWDVLTGSLDLAAGANTITLLWAPGNTGWVNLDYIEIN